ncbi:MAG: hypothetical protein ACKVYV_03660 [Limisphaerales bacterium]
MQARIIQLRDQLAARVPGVRFGFAPERPAGARRPTGVPALDAALGGGLGRGELVELVGNGCGSGSAQALHALLDRTARDGGFLTLVDGADTFDADAAEPDVLAHLLWLRCHGAAEALKAADLVLRDRNLALVVLDLKANPAAELRRLPATAWHRFARLVAAAESTLLVITPSPLVAGVDVRIELAAGLGADAMQTPPAELAAGLRCRLLRTAAERVALARTA